MTKSLRPKQAAETLGISIATFWRWCKERADFPKPIHLSARCTVFDGEQLLAWRNSQKGFISFAYLMCILGAVLLIQAVLMAWPGILNGFDLTGIAMLGSGVIASRGTIDFARFSAAAKAQDQFANVILKNGEPVFTLESMGNVRELTTNDLCAFVDQYEKKLKLEAEYMDYLSRLSDSEVAAAPTMAEYFSEASKPAKVSTSINMKRPTIGELGDVLKETVDHAPDGFTRCTGSTASRWYEIGDERDTLYLEVDGVTACLEAQDDVTVFIRQGVTVDHARALLIAMADEFKSYPSFEFVTPLTPVSLDEVPF